MKEDFYKGLYEAEVEKNKELEQMLNCKKYFSETLPENTKFVILTKSNYDRMQKDLQKENIILQDKINKAIEFIEKNEDIDYNPTLDGSEDDSYNILPRSLCLFNEDLDRLVDILKGEDE
jgi:hypothetical protein